MYHNIVHIITLHISLYCIINFSISTYGLFKSTYVHNRVCRTFNSTTALCNEVYIYGCLISGLLLPHIWLTVASCLAYCCPISGLLLPHVWLIAAPCLAYCCLISGLLLPHVWLIAAPCLVYCCLISGLLLHHAWLIIVASYLAYGCLEFF